MLLRGADCRGPFGRNEGVPLLPGGDDGVQLPQQRGGDRATGLRCLQRIFLTCGQVHETSLIDAVRLQRTPGRSPRRGPQSWPAATGEPRRAEALPAVLFSRCQPSVFDQRPSGREPVRVTGLGQDRGGVDRGDPWDRGDELNEVELTLLRRDPNTAIRNLLLPMALFA